jgi:enoyl-[acyl-carrier protein] reductase / trans-2-enoyl-CoA reductase (NAD+)
MIVPLRMRGPLVVFAHPAGVRQRVRQWAAAACALGPVSIPPRVLVVGGSAGLGLATRVVATVAGSATIGVCHSRPGQPNRPGSAGWYATAEVHALAEQSGRPALTVVGDAFSDSARQARAQAIRDTVENGDLLVDSIAAARRRHPATGVVHRAAIRTIGSPFTDKTVDWATGEVRSATMPPASAAEIADTVAVMGGEDWAMWWRALREAGALSPNASTLAFSYQGGPRLRPTYRGGTLGAAKDDLERTARSLGTAQRPARVVITAAHVTQSSAMIPMSALYWMLLARVLGAARRLEGPVEQAHRLFADVLPADEADATGRLRLDDRELDPLVRAEVERRWDAVTTANLAELGAPAAYRAELLRGAGFSVDGVDEAADVDPVCPIEAVVAA